MNNKDELYHYGVKGMKWKGHVYATRDELKDAKRKYKAEKKEFKRDRKEMLRYMRNQEVEGDAVIDGETRQIKEWHNAQYKYDKMHSQLVTKKGEEYANKVWNGALKKQKINRIAALGIVTAGAAALVGVTALYNE